MDSDIRTKVLIIGGGMTGILCAYFLHQEGADYCLLEQADIGGGTTCGTTAKITVLQGAIYDRLLKKEGMETAALYLKATEQAKKQYRALGHQVDCDMEEKDAYLYARTDRGLLERELTAIERLGHPAEFVEQTKLPFETAGALCCRNQLQFHPLKFMDKLAEGLHIYEQTKVKEMTEYFAVTENGSVAAEKVIVATHFPFLNTRGSYYLKLYQQRAYVVALRNAPDVDGMYMDAVPGGLSFRNAGELLVVGGKSHRTGTAVFRDEKEKKSICGMKAFEQEIRQLYPQTELAAVWAAQDCMSLDGVPYIGRYSAHTPDLFVAAGYNKWGMTGSMIAAQILCDLVQERENEFSHIFSPSRSILKSQLAKNIGSAAKGMLNLWGKKRCSHMGCVLKWNREEQVWECPCHGSRFDKEGEVLDNPAMKRIKNKT
ncbi:MAG: FAD-dependent oxidoreductase [Clostridiales bacterium]|nr:FAD-dependent oxidoreductase [Clostridiales bacterium]